MKELFRFQEAICPVFERLGFGELCDLQRERERVMAMLHVSSACYFNLRQRRFHRIRGVASEDFAGLKVEEKKVKLGGSDLKVTKLGIGAWSWGDTSYWNNFEWDGKLLQKSLIKRRNYR